MPRNRHFVLRLVVTAGLVLSACSAGDDSASEDPGGDTPTSKATTYSISPYDTDDVVSLDGETLDPLPLSGPGALIERGVELDEWTEVEGAITLLKTQVGEIDPDDVEGLDLVLSASGSEVLHLAQELIDDAETEPADRDELVRLLGLVSPSKDWTDAVRSTLDDDGDDVEVPRIRKSPSQTADGCVADVSPDVYPYVTGGVTVDCWMSMYAEVSTPGRTGVTRIVVVYSEGSDEHATAALDAFETTSRTLHQWSDVNPFTFALITPERMFTKIDGKRRQVWGAAMRGLDDECIVSLSDADLGADDAFRQLVAHEQVHCFQHHDYPDFDSDDRWFIEGGADYLSHLIYPGGKLERATIGLFMARSVSRSLSTMSYEAWVWWQYLSNRTSPSAVFDLHRRMAGGDAVDVLAAVPDMAEIFHTFTIDLRTTGLQTHGAPIPESREITGRIHVDGAGDHTQTSERFVATRLGVFYAPEQRYEQVDKTQTEGRMNMAPFEDRHNRAAWQGLPPEVLGSCEESEVYVMVATTIAPEPHVVRWDVETTESECDPCLTGTWIVDNDAFLDTIMSFGGVPAGFGFSIDLVGDYFVRFDGNGSGNAWRNGWQMITSGSAGGMSMSITTTWDSVETFRYAGDGERFAAWDSIVVDHRTTMESAGLPFSVVDTPSATTVSIFGAEQTVETPGPDVASAAGTYSCDDDRLEIGLDMAPTTPLVFTRTTDVAEPPTALP